MADKKVLAAEGPVAFYRGYIVHNYEFLAWAAMFAGCKKIALEAARELVTILPESFLRSFAAAADYKNLLLHRSCSIGPIWRMGSDRSSRIAS